jgi:hypothetical protein
MKSIAWLEPDQEFVGDVLGIEQVFASVGLSVDPSPNESLEDQLVVDRHLVIPVAPTGCKVSGWSPISTVMPHQLMVRFHYPPLVIFAIASTSSKPSSDMLVAAT